MKRFLLLLFLAPLMAIAQHTVSGYATITKNTIENPAYGKKLFLVPFDSLNLKYNDSINKYRDKFMEMDVTNGIVWWKPKPEFHDKRKEVQKEYFRLESLKVNSIQSATLCDSAKSVLIDINGTYKFGDVQDGKYYLIMDIGMPVFYTYQLSLVNGKDVTQNINGTL